MLRLLSGIERRYFDGDARRGPRQAYILGQLARRGCVAHTDRNGNIWVEKGEGKPLVLYSSHMDVDPRVGRRNFTRYRPKDRRLVGGVLDNAVGCMLNILLAEKGPKSGRAIYVFTASEEVDRKNDRKFARSAREVVTELRRIGLKPDLCVAVDVTYPRLLHHHQNIDWSREHHEIFHVDDRTHCYLDGYLDARSRKIGERLVKKFRHLHVHAREFPGYDEAAVYSRISPAFAFGPVVSGHFDRPNQTMKLLHAKTALRFLKQIEI